MDENDIPKLRFLSYFDLCLLTWLNTVAVFLCTAYEELKDDEVLVIMSGQRYG
jgi:hypothetical protein